MADTASPWYCAKVLGAHAGDRVEVAEDGLSFVRFLSSKFRHNDGGTDFGYLGVGIQVLFGGVEE
jgi:hypothetical protein